MAFAFDIGNTVGHLGCDWTTGYQQRLFIVARKTLPVPQNGERNVYMVRAILRDGAVQNVVPTAFEVYEEELKAYP